MSKKDDIHEKITKFYLTSGDFNGLPIKLTNCKPELKGILISLIQEDKISLVFGDTFPNPHIKPFLAEPKEKQVEKLQNLDSEYCCAYPSLSHLKEVIDPSEYRDRPFTFRLALGEPQLSFESFDLSVLEFYRNDPRYYYRNDNITGSIGVHSEDMPESDQVLLKFGFSHDPDLNRAVAVYLRYLSGLTPQHQQIWNGKILEGDYILHPDYYRSSILGKWYERISIFQAFTLELHHINKMCKLIGRPPLFKDEEINDRRFSFLMRPTLKEYSDFMHLLDKAISENINRKFFRDDASFEYDEVRKDGKVVVRQKGTIQILDDWLKLMYRADDRKPIEEMIDTFKQIRQLRQRPAHAIDDDVFDQKYFKQQRTLIIKAYKAIRLLRLIFANHPSVAGSGYTIPDCLQSGKIWDI